MPSFFNLDSFRNVTYALNIALENHIANLVFNGDLSRIVYASNEFAFRKRAELLKDDYNNLDLPFVNYYLVDYTTDTDRKWWNNVTYLDGVYISEIQRSIRLAPVKITYESTFFVQRQDDLLYATHKFIFDESHETILYPNIIIDTVDIPVPAILGYNMSFDSEYNENDYLEKNKIKTLELNFDFDTFSLMDNLDVYLSNEIVFNFLVHKGIIHKDDPFSEENIYILLTQYFDADDF